MRVHLSCESSARGKEKGAGEEAAYVEPRDPRKAALAEDICQLERRLDVGTLLCVCRASSCALERLTLDAVRFGSQILRRLEVHVAELGRERLGDLLRLADTSCEGPECQ